ncbi:MAG: hypothetical protein KatS3mg001_450 [Candidatus Pacearchaeota archaeon]|nr:MAG: hypothetical protein KatS3mg001_450 [Candidatus Pacearchaeota archaeon]
MVKIVLTPDWFLSADVFIDFFSFFVVVIFSLLAIKNYKISKNKRFLYVGVGFLLISIAQLASLITKLILYYDIGPSEQIGQAIIASNIVNSVDVFYYAGFFFHRFLTLAGLFLIYRLPRKQKMLEDYFLIFYFILISALLSKEFYYIYHITSFVLISLIIRNYYEIYSKNRFYNTKILILAFSILALSQLIFIFSVIDILFVVGGLVELVSYLIFLFLILKILDHGKEKNKNRHNIRYVGNNSRKKSRN